MVNVTDVEEIILPVMVLVNMHLEAILHLKSIQSLLVVATDKACIVLILFFVLIFSSKECECISDYSSNNLSD
jgi:hypothetical protein